MTTEANFQKYITSKQVMADYVGLIKQSQMTISSYELFEKNGRILTKTQNENKSNVEKLISHYQPLVTKLTKYVREYEQQFIQAEYSIKLEELDRDISRSCGDSKGKDKGNTGKNK